MLYKVMVHFCNGFRSHEILMRQTQGHSHTGESTCHISVQMFFFSLVHFQQFQMNILIEILSFLLTICSNLFIYV